LIVRLQETANIQLCQDKNPLHAIKVLGSRL